MLRVVCLAVLAMLVLGAACNWNWNYVGAHAVNASAPIFTATAVEREFDTQHEEVGGIELQVVAGKAEDAVLQQYDRLNSIVNIGRYASSTRFFDAIWRCFRQEKVCLC